MFVRIVHIALAFSVLLSTTGISVHRHYCRDTAMGTSWFIKSQHCSGEAHKSCSAGGHCGKKTSEKHSGNCCKDLSEYHQLDQDKQQTNTQYKPLNHPVALAPDFPPITLPGKLNSNAILPYLRHRPPLIRGPVQPWLQVFRF